MKTTTIVIIIFLIIIFSGVAGFFIAKQFQPEPDNNTIIAQHKAEKREYVENAQRMSLEILRLEDKIDSLEMIPREIEKQIVYLQAGVDSVIASDSSKVVSEYRKGLVLLQIRPDVSLDLSTREKGLGALIFRETYGLRLKVINLNETNAELHNLAQKQERLLEIKDNIIEIDSLIFEAQELLIDELDSFWRNRFIIYMGGGAGYDGTTLRPELQMGIGIRIVGND